MNSFPTELPSFKGYILDFGKYVPKREDYLPQSFINLSGTINGLAFSALKTGVKIHSNLCGMTRSIALASKTMQFLQLTLVSSRFGQAIKVLDTAYTVLDLFHFAGTIDYLTSQIGNPDLIKADHVMKIAFGTAALNDVVSFLSHHRLLELSPLGLSYGKITLFTLTLGRFANFGVAFGFAAWTYKEYCCVKEIGMKGMIREYAEENKFKKSEKNSFSVKADALWKSVHFNTMIWAASEFALFVIPMAVSVPASVQLGSAVVIKALGIRSFLLSH